MGQGMDAGDLHYEAEGRVQAAGGFLFQRQAVPALNQGVQPTADRRGPRQEGTGEIWPWRSKVGFTPSPGGHCRSWFRCCTKDP